MAIYLSDGNKTTELTRDNFAEHVRFPHGQPLQSALGNIGEQVWIVEAGSTDSAAEMARNLTGCNARTTYDREVATGYKWGKLDVTTIPGMQFPFYTNRKKMKGEMR